MNKTLNAYRELKYIPGLHIISRTDILIKFSYKNMRVKYFVNSEIFKGSNIEQGKGLNKLLKLLTY